jgi:iron complex transport system substrate-binding protein
MRARTLPLTTLLLAVLLLVPACAGSDATTDRDGAGDRSAGPTASQDPASASPAGEDGGDGAFPVRIEHRFGTTTVEARPERVVSVGFNDHDTILALGTTPVAAREWYGEFPSATWEWAQDELGGAEMEVLSSGELDFEQIAGLEPDLIVGVFSGMTEADYALLSRIAPTVASPAEHPDFGTPWREVTRIYGDALGVPDRAAEVVADLDAQLEEARAAHSEFEGAEAVVAFYAGGEIGAYTSSDLRSRLLVDLGFAIPAEIDEAAGEGAFFAPVSLEQTDLIDRDAVVWVTATEEEIAEVQQLEVRDGLPMAAEGREVFTDFTTNGAFSFSSPLSIPYLLDTLVPQLAAAVDGDPATAVAAADG